VRNTHKDKVPEEWIRKQTLVNAERYITEELKEYEAKILGAEERLELSKAFLKNWSMDAAIYNPRSANAKFIAQIDVLCGFATGKKHNYNYPKIDDEF
jgi:DNA mismatch repair protein MutS